jgi:Fur family ferric uptake transcriptional regulator
MDSTTREEFIKAKRHLDTEVVRRNFRKSTERYKLLEELYKFHDHFMAEEFYLHLIQNNFQVSMATVYNNLVFFEEVGLVLKHQFGKGQAARYERALGRKQHCHLICLRCNQILSFVIHVFIIFKLPSKSISVQLSQDIRLRYMASAIEKSAGIHTPS